MLQDLSTYLKHIMLSVVATASLSTGIVRADSDQPPDFATLVKHIDEASHAIRNVEIKGFKLLLESRDPASSNWEVMKFTIEGDAWYNGLPNSKVRIHVSKRVMAWDNGPAPWLEAQDDLGYDGQFGRIVNYVGGPLGQPTADNTAAILPDAPVLLRDRYQTLADGTAFSTNFYRDTSKSTLPEVLKTIVAEAKLTHKEVPTEWDILFGTQVVKFSLGDPKSVFVGMWFDAAHGYALRKVERTFKRPSDGSIVLSELTEVPKLIEAAPGIWWPIEGSREEPDPSARGHQRRATFHATNIVVNNPKFDDRIFTVPFPAEYWVNDQVRGVSFYTTSAKQTAAEIDKDVALLKVKQNSSSTNQVSPVMTGGVIPPNKTVSRAYPLTDIFAGIIAFGIVVVSIAVWMRKRTNVKRMTVFVIGGICTLSVIKPLRAGSQLSNVDNQIVQSNCGVNVAYFGLKWFGQSPDFWQVARALNVGDDLERYCSLADIKHVWIDHGIDVKGFEADGLPQIIQHIPPAGLVVLRLSRIINGVDLGHFVILIPDSTGIIVVDPPKASQHFSDEEAAKDRNLSRCAKEFLIANLTPIQLGADPRPVFYMPTLEVDMGRIPIGTNDFSGSFVYANHGNEILKILHARKSCSCMQEPTGDFTVKPGEDGKIKLMFSRSKVTGGLNQRALLLQTNDPLHSNVLVVFTFDLAETPTFVETNISPRAVDYRWSRCVPQSGSKVPICFAVSKRLTTARSPKVRNMILKTPSDSGCSVFRR